jgi:hypothetical protein
MDFVVIVSYKVIVNYKVFLLFNNIMIKKIFAIIVIIIIIMIYLFFINRYIYETILNYVGLYQVRNIYTANVKDRFRDSETKGETIANRKYNYNMFNKLYNMNYHKDRLYKKTDLTKLKKTEGFVLYEPEIFEIYLYETKIKLYKAEILYKVDNKFYENEEYLITFLNEFKDEPYKKLVKFRNKIGDNKYIFIRSTIITIRNIERGDYMTVYYESKEKDCRIAPPLLEEKYVYYAE